MSIQQRRHGIPLDQIVRPQHYPQFLVPAGVRLKPDDQVFASVQAVWNFSAAGERHLAVYAHDTDAILVDGERVQSHEDLHRHGLSWRDASVFGTSAKPLSSHDDKTLRTRLIDEYATTIHAVGARAAWQGVTLAKVLEGLRQMEHALKEQVLSGPGQPILLSPRVLIRTAPWGRLLATGFDQPAIGRWHPAGGLVYLETGSSWQALTPLLL